MKNEFLYDLFVDCLKDLYSAERQLVSKGLPAMIEAATNSDLKAGFEEHLSQTEEHVARLEKVGEVADIPLNGKKCLGIEGLIQEGEELIKMGLESRALDMGLTSAAMKVEHYEVVGYTTAIMLANLMGHDEAAEILEDTLNEEIETNGILEDMAQTMADELSE